MMFMPELGGMFCNVLNVKSIEVYDLWRRRGIFKSLLAAFEEWIVSSKHGYSAVYIQNITDKDLYEFLGRRPGWAYPGVCVCGGDDTCMAFLAPHAEPLNM
jgi:GNAT superfamily N-acetyltransferase